MIKHGILRKLGYIHESELADVALDMLRINADKKVAIHTLCRNLGVNLNDYIIKPERNHDEQE